MQIHLSDRELIQLQDRELPGSVASKANHHLGQCPQCRERLLLLEGTSETFGELYDQQQLGSTHHHAGDQAALRARLERELNIIRGSVPSRTRQNLALAAGILLVLSFGGILSLHRTARTNPENAPGNEQALGLPLRSITPGATRSVTVAEICSAPVENDPPVQASVERTVLRAYGRSASSSRDYQLDYLISPALGGTEDLRNLWPQPSSARWNSQMKDRLEDHLHELVCRGELPLSVAQDEIAKNWIAAYQKYFAVPA